MKRDEENEFSPCKKVFFLVKDCHELDKKSFQQTDDEGDAETGH